MAFAAIFFVALLAVPVLLLIVFIPIAIHAERERKERIRGWAAAHGWMFRERSTAAFTARLPGRNRHGLGVTVTGQLGGRWVTVAEYSYQTTSGSGDSQSTTTHHYIVALVLLDRPHPPLAVRQRGLVSQFGRALFGDKPTATGNVLFDAKFRIDAADPGHAKAMVGPNLVAAHIAGAVPQWSLVGNELLTYTSVSGKLKDPEQIPWYAGQLLHVADLLGPLDLVIPDRR
ncbi:hypothetical protein [Nocardia concava]|uniref:hypothetical protein n=1 Tax=Nocardia concava TaxID=257281 RepID=UPI0002F4EB45|nr:hypothetical protein [Nocardia concava]